MNHFGIDRVCTLSMPKPCRVRRAIHDATLAMGPPPDEVSQIGVGN